LIRGIEPNRVVRELKSSRVRAEKNHDKVESSFDLFNFYRVDPN